MSKHDGARCRVLVVDDNLATATATAKYLELSGYETRRAMTGAAAIDEAEAWRPDAVLLDLGLPDMDGFGVIAELQRLNGADDVLYIGISGRGDDETVERAGAAGFREFLVKPVRLDTIKALLPQSDN